MELLKKYLKKLSAALVAIKLACRQDASPPLGSNLTHSSSARDGYDWMQFFEDEAEADSN